jgi:hypothetical protein
MFLFGGQEKVILRSTHQGYGTCREPGRVRGEWGLLFHCHLTALLALGSTGSSGVVLAAWGPSASCRSLAAVCMVGFCDGHET